MDIPLVTDLQMAEEAAAAELQADGWLQADGNLRSGVYPSQPKLRLLYKTSAQEKGGGASGEHITELMPHFGDDEPFFGFERIKGGKIMDAKPGRWESVDLIYRRGNPSPPKVDKPVFRTDGTFKIMQSELNRQRSRVLLTKVADLHYSVGEGECRDTNKDPCSGDKDTATWLGEALDAERPDMVVFSGDQLNGQKTSYDSASVLAKFAAPVIDRKIPWAAVFGEVQISI